VDRSALSRATVSVDVVAAGCAAVTTDATIITVTIPTAEQSARHRRPRARWQWPIDMSFLALKADCCQELVPRL
jgi:hypothetical protein